MGNSVCSAESKTFEIITSTNQKAIKNLQNFPDEIPSKQFAVLATSIPKINPKIQEILQKNFHQELKDIDISNKKSKIKKAEGVEFPWFIINHKQCYYKGQWKNKLPHGKGQAYFNNGAFYQGFFIQGEAQSQDGLFVFDDLSFYRGQIKKSLFNGKGRFQSQSGMIYEGEWKDNLPHGQGIQLFTDNNRYEGQFANGYKQGYGKFYWNDGKIYQGQFLQGKAHGKGTITKNKTHKFQGKFKNNKKIQSGKMRTSEGVYTGPFVNGLPQNKGIFEWKAKGTKYQGQFNEGRIQGQGILIDKNGKKSSGIWKDGLLIQQLNLRNSILKSKSKPKSKIVDK